MLLLHPGFVKITADNDKVEKATFNTIEAELNFGFFEANTIVLTQTSYVSKHKLILVLIYFVTERAR